MNLDKMVKLAYDTQWTKVNHFTIDMHIEQEAYSGLLPLDIQPMLNLALTSCTAPALSVTPMENYLGGKWFYANGHPEMAKITLTFRDYDHMTLYKMFTTIYEFSISTYASDLFMTLHISTDRSEGDPLKFMTFNNMLIEQISEVSFSNSTENQIAEFSITLKGIRQRVSETMFANTSTSTLESVF
jgi:hypothetical protein